MAYLPISLLDQTTEIKEDDFIEITRKEDGNKYHSYKVPLTAIVDIEDDVIVDDPGLAEDDSFAELVTRLQPYFVTTGNPQQTVSQRKDFKSLSAESLTAKTSIVQNGLTSLNNVIVNASLSVKNQITCEVLQGIALSACWADLAEKYEADKYYQPGTLVKFGGEKEITVADDYVNAVVSTNPAVVLDSKKEGDNVVNIALAGKVPILVKGSLNKFDKIHLSKDLPGIAEKAVAPYYDVIGIALEDKPNDDVSTVLCVSRFQL